ncbi:hypothetical protein GQ457_13G018690 [Hibiscus cannabinus]
MFDHCRSSGLRKVISGHCPTLLRSPVDFQPSSATALGFLRPPSTTIFRRTGNLYLPKSDRICPSSPLDLPSLPFQLLQISFNFSFSEDPYLKKFSFLQVSNEG